MNTERIKVIEKETGNVYEAVKIEGGYQLYTSNNDPYKKLKDSTIKRYYKKLKAEQPEAPEEKVEKAPEKPEVNKTTPVEEISDEKREKLINTIRKTLALAENNPSEAEALAAALKAQELMAKYNIHKEEVTDEEIKDEIDSIFSEQPHDSHLMKWRKVLASIVSKAFRCKAYMAGKDVVFRGYREDAQLALEVYLMLYSVGHTLAKKTESKARSMSGTAKGVYNSFTTGFLKGVSDAFNEQCTALMIVTPQEVEEEFLEFSKNMKSSSTRLSVSDSKVYSDGYAEGKSAVKSRAIEKNKG